MEQIGRGRGLLVGPNVESDAESGVYVSTKAHFGSRSTLVDAYNSARGFGMAAPKRGLRKYMRCVNQHNNNVYDCEH